MALIKVIQGSSPPQLVELAGERTLIGRHPACQITIDNPAVGRNHAQILTSEGRYYLEDLRSRNGTWLNGNQISGRTEVKHGDQIRVCDVVLSFFGDLPDNRAASEQDMQFAWLPERLRGQHINYKGQMLDELRQQLSRSGSPLERELSQQFFRIVVLDAAEGLDGSGRFDMERFLQQAWKQLAAAFDHYFDADAFHPEQIAQLLKTEQQSLFCFFGVHLLSEDDLHRLRGLGFSQDVHRVLYCGSNPYLGTVSYPLVGPSLDNSAAPPNRLSSSSDSENAIVSDSSILGIATSSSICSSRDMPITVRPEVKLQALMEISRNLASASKTDNVLPKILESLFRIFPQAERGAVVLKEGETGQLAVKAVQTRSEADQSGMRVSRSILKRAIDDSQAVLSADVQDSRPFDQSDSIANMQIRSLMCAPLVGQDGVSMGAIQIDTLDLAHQFSQQDLDLLASVAAQSALFVELSRLQESARKQRDYERDLEFASQVQLGFLPKDRPRVANYEFFDFYEAARHVGGDFFDYVPLPDGRLAIINGDVAGLGTAAALLMARMYADARYEILASRTPAEAISNLNARVVASGMGHRFICLALIVIDPVAHVLTIVNAGHIPPLMRLNNGTVKQLGVDTSGLPLGIQPDVTFEQTDAKINVGDSVVMVTDGVTEAMNPANLIYGAARLVDFIKTAPAEAPALGEAIIADVEAFCEGQPQRDDICLVCFHRSA